MIHYSQADIEDAVAAENVSASRLSKQELDVLLQRTSSPKPQAERRCYPRKHRGLDKPFDHEDRRAPRA